jgi:hypothetical protein
MSRLTRGGWGATRLNVKMTMNNDGNGRARRGARVMARKDSAIGL